MRRLSVVILFASLIILYLYSCGVGTSRNEGNEKLNISFYPIDKYPILEGHLKIYKKDNKFQKIYLDSPTYYPYTSYFSINDDVILVELSGGFQDADEITSTCRDKLITTEPLFTFTGTATAITVLSPITTALYKFSKGNPDVFFEYFKKLPQSIISFHTRQFHHSGETENLRNFMYYLSKFVGMENVKKELEDNGLFDGSVVSGLDETTMDTLVNFLLNNSPFKDKLLEYCVRKALNKDLISPLTEDELKSINILECNKYGIRTLEGIENIPNLTFLSLYSNKIKDVSPLSNLKKLAFLDISDNLISDYNQIKSIDAGILFLENNCITTSEENNLSSLFNFIFGLDYQDKCKNNFYARIFTYEPETKKLKVAVSSKYFEPYSCRIFYPKDNTTSVAIPYNLYADGNLKEIDISSYTGKPWISLHCSDYFCPDMDADGIYYDKYIYFGKNILLEERDEVSIKEPVTCYTPVYVENGKEIHYCYKVYETDTGLEMKHFVFDFSTGKYLDFEDNFLSGYFVYNSFLYIFLQEPWPNSSYVAKIIKLDINNLEIISEIIPADSLKTSHICYQDSEYIYMCGTTISIYKKENLTPYKMDILNMGNAISIKKIIDLGDYTYIFAFDIANREEVLYIVNTNTLINLDSSSMINLEDLALKKIYLEDYFSGITKDPSLRIDSILTLNGKIYLTTSYWGEILVLDTTNPLNPIFKFKVNVLEDPDGVHATSSLLIYRDYLIYVTGHRIAFYKIQADGSLIEELNTELKNIYYISSAYIRDNEGELVIFGDSEIHRFLIKNLN